MIKEVVQVRVDGQAADDIVPDILEIELEENVDAADLFRVRLALRQETSGSWLYVDDERFHIWNRLSVDAGYPGDHETIIDGYITHIDVELGRDEGDSWLELSGMDYSCVLDLDDKQFAWTDKKDHEIAQTIFSSYGLNYEVEDTIVSHAAETSTTLQTESDMGFLRRLAARNGFECFIKGRMGYFRSPDMRERPQKILAIQFGDETNLSSLRVRVDGTPASIAEIRRLDPLEKREEIQVLSGSARRKLGSSDLASLQSAVADGRTFLKGQIAGSAQEMRGKLKTACEGASRFVSLEGQIDGRVYKSILRPKRLVTVKGAGKNFSGLYYVSKVAHLFTTDEYTQRFEAYRNGIGLTGDEDFSAASLLPLKLPTVPALAGAGSRSGSDRVLPPSSQFGSTGGF